MFTHGKRFFLSSLFLLAVAGLFLGCPPNTGPKAAFKAEPDSGAVPLILQR